MAQDDWRVTVTLRPEHAGRIRRALHEAEVELEAAERLSGRVIVGGQEETGVVYLYAATREGAREAGRFAAGLLAEHGLDGDVAIHRWHPVEERWESPDVPLPATDAQLAAEHERLEQDEAAESEELGAALWEVRIELLSHHEAKALAGRLEPDHSVVRRWKYLLVGAGNEAQAKEFAERLKGELPPGSTLHVEPSGALVWEAMPANPFAVLGGLGA